LVGRQRKLLKRNARRDGSWNIRQRVVPSRERRECGQPRKVWKRCDLVLRKLQLLQIRLCTQRRNFLEPVFPCDFKIGPRCPSENAKERWGGAALVPEEGKAAQGGEVGEGRRDSQLVGRQVEQVKSLET